MYGVFNAIIGNPKTYPGVGQHNFSIYITQVPCKSFIVFSPIRKIILVTLNVFGENPVSED